jgi:hypothetical protein
MNMTNAYKIKIAVTQVLYRSIIAINRKHYSRLFSKIMPT